FRLIVWLLVCNSYAHRIHESLLKYPWKASWVETSDVDEYGFGVYLFRTQLNVNRVPNDMRINISADNKYLLYINGTLVSHGPVQSDVFNWKFHTVDISKYLRPGNNIIAAKVWNFGQWRPEVQMSMRT